MRLKCSFCKVLELKASRYLSIKNIRPVLFPKFYIGFKIFQNINKMAMMNNMVCFSPNEEETSASGRFTCKICLVMYVTL